jgi:hypothetical protein
MYHYVHDYMYLAPPTQLYVCSLSYYTLPKVTVVKMYIVPLLSKNMRHWVAAATLTTVAAASTASAALSAYIVVCQTQKVQKNCV